MNKQEVYDMLSARGIWHEITEHRAVYNMADLEQVPLPYPEADAKNLFVRDDKKQHYYLITVRGDKRVDLKAFRRANGTRPLSFACPEELQAVLGLVPGAVTPFGLLNDNDRRVEFFLDKDLTVGKIGCHPNDNTATVWLESCDLIALLQQQGCPVHIVQL